MDNDELNEKLEDIFRSMSGILGHGVFFILEGQTVVECPDMKTWAEWRQKHSKERIVKKTRIRDSEVSTVFLGMDSRMLDEPEQIFETMVFGGKHDLYMARYATYQQALEGHKKVCAKVVDD